MHCENEQHSTPVEAAATITLRELADDPSYTGYQVCSVHLIEYVQFVFVDQPHSNFRLDFAVEAAR